MIKCFKEGISSGWLSVLGLPVLLLASGCYSVKTQLAREESAQQTKWQTLSASTAPACTPLTWETMLVQLGSHNAKLLGARLNVQRANEALVQVHRSLIPMANIQASYTRSLGSDNSGLDPFSIATTLFLDVPGFVSYKTREEAARLAVIRSTLALEGIWREQIIDLFRAVIACQEAEEQAALLQRRAEAVANLAPAAPLRAGSLRRELALEHDASDARLHEARLRLAEVLGWKAGSVNLEGTLPDLGYNTPASRPAPEAMGQLPLKLGAVELVALRARQLGIKFDYWPQFNLSITSPTIYQREAGQSTYWSSQQILVGSNAFWTLDTQGRNASQERLVESELTQRREVLAQEAAQLADKLRFALSSLASTDARLDQLQAAAASAPDRLQASIAPARAALQMERCEWKLVLWFFDDARWSSCPPPEVTDLRADADAARTASRQEQQPDHTPAHNRSTPSP